MSINYLDKIKSGLNKKIAIFASGQGSLAQNIIQVLEPSRVSVECIYTNHSSCGATTIANNNKIKLIINTKDLNLVEELKSLDIDMIVLAGYTRKIPNDILDNFKVMNIHPSLLPKFGGKGMYGINVHKSVIESKEKFSGMTIHWVNNEYDMGEHIIQKQLAIYKNWNEYDLEKEVKKLEMKWYPEIIKRVLYNTL